MMFYRKLLLAVVLGSLFVNIAFATCYDVEIKLQNDSSQTWTLQNRQISPGASFSGGSNYTNIGPDQNGYVQYYADENHTVDIQLTYTNNKSDQVVFSIQRSTHISDLDGEVTQGTNFAQLIQRHNSCDNIGIWGVVQPSVTFEFISPPMEEVKIKVGFDSASEANIAAKNLESLLDTTLLDSLDTKYGKPVDIEVVDKKQVELTFMKDCDNNACGYN